MAKKYNKWMRQLAPLAQWDPAEEGLSPRVEYNVTKINHLTKRWMKENGHENWEKKYGMTLYDIAKHHPTGNNMMLISGVIAVEDYTKRMDEGLKGNKLYLPAIDDPEQFIETMRSLCTDLTAIINGAGALDLPTLGEVSLPEETALTAINALLADAKVPNLEVLFDEISDVVEQSVEAIASEKEKAKALTKAEKQVDALKDEVSNLMMRAESVVSAEYSTDKGEIPDGKVVSKKASEIFPEVKLSKDFEIPVWEWEGDHPDVPAVDPHYIFRPKHLSRALYAIVTNQREYIQGHTGSGKTTLVEQIAARLNWPFIRINFDSEITRMDLIGRDTLVADEDGKVTSQFEDGMLPTAMSGPYICCFDELDFVRPDVAYVMQAALEGNGLRITEDGDRLVRPHPMFRMFGTGNTVGQGDEHGMYQGARPQSMAFLDRFTIWDKVDYLRPEERESLVDLRYPMLDEKDKKMVLQYTTEHLEAFSQGKVIQPISPRGMLAICQAAIYLGSVKEALEMSVLDRANTEDRATLKGLVDRVTK